MNELLQSPVFGIGLTLLAYVAGARLRELKPFSRVPPLVTAVAIIIPLLLLLGVPTAAYNAGGSMLSQLIAPATVLLAVPIYNRREIIRRNLAAVLIGCFVGCAVNLVSVLALCKLFGFDRELTATLLPKSVTTPIGMGVSQMLGGVPEITAAAVIFTGFVGAVCAPALLRLIKSKSEIADGLAIGASSHVLGTSRAMEMGELCGACSGTAIGLCGLITVVLAAVFGGLL